MSEHTTAMMWFEGDLRLSDNVALTEACRTADTIVPIFVVDEPGDGWPVGRGRAWWRERSVRALDEALRERGSRLVLRRGSAVEVVPAVAREVGARRVVWNRRFRPARARRDEEVAERLRDNGVEVVMCDGRLLHDPEAVRTTSGGPYHVYTPFWRKFREVVEVDEPLGVAPIEPGLAPEVWPESDDIDLAPEEAHPGDLEGAWTPGETAAQSRLEVFTEGALAEYASGRERPDQDGTSRLSPHLRAGELSPRQVWWAVRGSEAAGAAPEDVETYLKELVWREFSYHLLHHYPRTHSEPLRDKFADFDWEEDAEAYERWTRGETGYPIVDAGMRQLQQTGWMHNRVRMIVASFLTKDLLIPWQAGARWFFEYLVDADLANNTMGWQWSAGCGADAQPFFRVFNPVTQSERHDPQGDYIRRHLPQLAELDAEAIHAPWEAGHGALREAGVSLGEDYARPIVDHAQARKRALERYEALE